MRTAKTKIIVQDSNDGQHPPDLMELNPTRRYNFIFLKKQYNYFLKFFYEGLEFFS